MRPKDLKDNALNVFEQFHSAGRVPELGEFAKYREGDFSANCGRSQSAAHFRLAGAHPGADAPGLVDRVLAAGDPLRSGEDGPDI